MKKKTLYISNLGLLDNLGVTQILSYLEGLAKEGYKITIMSFEKSENTENISKIKKVEDILSLHRIKWLRLRYHNRWGNILDIIVGTFVAAHTIIKDKIDVIHARASIPMIFGWPLAKIFKKRIIYDRRGTMYGDFIDDVNVKNLFSVKHFSVFLEKIDTFFMRHSDAVIVLSEKSKTLLEDKGVFKGTGAICEWIPCCVDLKRFEKNVSVEHTLEIGDKFVVSYVGSLGTCYLLDRMIDFFKVLEQKRKNAFFLVVSHSSTRMVEEAFSKKGVSCGKFAIIDSDPKDVPFWIEKSVCSVMFIKEVECKIGSSPTKFAESLAAGIPVVINRGIGDTEDIIRRKKIGCVVDGLNEAGYKKAITDLEGLIKENDELKERCKKVAKELFSLEEGIERYKTVYNRV